MLMLNLGCGEDQQPDAINVDNLMNYTRTWGEETGGESIHKRLQNLKSDSTEDGGSGLINFIVANGEHLPFKDATFDRVECRRFLGRGYDPTNCVLLEVFRVLRSAGTFYMWAAYDDVVLYEQMRMLMKHCETIHIELNYNQPLEDLEDPEEPIMIDVTCIRRSDNEV